MRKVYSKHRSVSFLGKRVVTIRDCGLGAENARLNFDTPIDIMGQKDSAYIVKSVLTGTVTTNCKMHTDPETEARFRFAYKNEYKLRPF